MFPFLFWKGGALPVVLVLVTTQALAQTVTSDKQVYTADEPIVVQYFGMPDSDGTNWICVALASAPTDSPSYVTYEYVYDRSGSLSMAGLDPGDYEIRTYFNWPGDGYTVRLRQPFRVVLPTGVSLETNKQVYEQNEPILVTFSNMPGNNSDWISVAKSEAPINAYEQHHYLEGARNGQLRFEGLSAGDYEVRAYWNWPRGGYESILAKEPFTVGEPDDGREIIVGEPEDIFGPGTAAPPSTRGELP